MADYCLFDNLSHFEMQPVPDNGGFETQYTTNSDSGPQTIVDIDDIPDDIV